MGEHVCFLVSEHPFLDARIFKKEAKSLLKQGYKMTMIVPRKNGNLFDVDGSVFTDCFQKQTFIHEGIKVVTYEQICPQKNIKTLLYNMQSGTAERFTDPLTALGIAEEADIYHAHEFFSLYSGVGVKRALTEKGKQVKLIYDSHELEPDPLSYEAQKTKNIKTQILEQMLNEVDYVITVSNSIKAWYLSINPKLQVEVIYNSPPLAYPRELKQGTDADFLLAYEGNISPKRGSFHKLMDVLDLCQQEFNLNLKVKMIGGEKVSSKAPALSIPAHLKDKVIFTGWVNYESIPGVMRDADMGWVDLDAFHSLNNRFAMPNKFFSYLNNGVPVLVNQCKDMESFIQRYGCGHVVSKLQATARDYAEAISFLHANRERVMEMGRSARKAMETTYSWGHMEKKLFAVYKQL
ncbi:MAG TPA: glycosyltransferase [Virgibacillus sp.]|nr:glycosyltransferase [Virgibacillus sp.]HLR66613.1 glycosyltransferase [Virgibacillus sp.]